MTLMMRNKKTKATSILPISIPFYQLLKSGLIILLTRKLNAMIRRVEFEAVEWT